MFCASQSILDWSKNTVYYIRIKHIDVIVYVAIEDQELQLKKIHIAKNAIDILTKVIPKEKLELCNSFVGMHSLAKMNFT